MAIEGLEERKGSSLRAIKNFIATNFDVNIDIIYPRIKKYLKEATEDGILVQTSGSGATGSFKLSNEKKMELKKDEKMKLKLVLKKKKDEEKAQLAEKKKDTAKMKVTEKKKKLSEKKKTTTPKVKPRNVQWLMQTKYLV